MTYTQAEYDALKSAYALGASTVKYADKEVVYRSRAEMKAILNEMADELGINTTIPRRKYIVADKGCYTDFE